MTDSDEDLVGVHGWLLFFVIALIFIVPILSAAETQSALSDLAKNDPIYAKTTDFEDTQAGAWFVWVVSSILSIIAGLLLAFRHKPSSPWIAIVVLWLVGPCLNGLILWGMQTYGEEITPQLWFELIRSFVPPIIWTAYLRMSKRVANTYVSPDKPLT